MKCQILFSGKNKKNIINLSSAESVRAFSDLKSLLIFTNWPQINKKTLNSQRRLGLLLNKLREVKVNNREQYHANGKNDSA